MHTFSFDDDYTGSSGLSFNFTRALPTRTYDGTEVSGGKPRYDRPVSIVPASIVPISMLGGTNHSLSLFASGYNAAGTSPLWVMYYDTPSAKYLRVVKVEIPDTNTGGTAFTNSSQYNDTVLNYSTTAPLDLMRGAITDRAYLPMDAIVVYGSIWVGCSVSVKVSTTADLVPWRPNAYAILRSCDMGLTWEVVIDDVALNEARGVGRGSPFMMQNYYTPGHRGSGAITEAWLAITDYRGAVPENPGGCTVDVFRIRRGGATLSTWQTDKEISPGSYANPTLRIRTADVADPAGPSPIPTLTHVHSAGLLKKGNHLVLIAAIGDIQHRNRLIKWVLEDYFLDTSMDYTDRAAWFKNNQWHGSYDRDPTNPADGDGQSGWQSVGCCQHPIDDDALLIGSDLAANAIVKLTIDGTDAFTGKAKLDHVYGVQSAMSGSLVYAPSVFVMKSQAPERPEPIIASLDNFALSFSPTKPDFRISQWKRILLDNKSNGVDWCMVQRGNDGEHLTGVNNALVVNDTIYLSHQYDIGATSLPALSRITMPTKTVTCRPLLVGGGGRNYVLDNFNSYLEPWSGNPHSITTISRNSMGLFQDGSVVLDPQPPTMINQILRIDTVERTTHNVGFSTVGGYVVDRVGSTGVVGLFQEGSAARRMRAWILGATSTLMRTKTTSFNSHWFDYQGHVSNINRSLDCVSSNRWIPHVYADDFFRQPHGIFGNYFNISVQLFSSLYDANPDKMMTDPGSDVQRYYIAPEYACDTNDGTTPGYPLPPGDDTSVHPHEEASISGFTLSSSWTLLLSGMMSDSSWDQCYSPAAVFDLCTLYRDANNYITISADTKSQSLRLTARVAGSDVPIQLIPGWLWVRDSPFLVGLSFIASSPYTLRVSASFAGGRVQTVTPDLGSAFGAALNELRFSNHDRTKVHEFRWIGGLINDSVAISQNDLDAALTSLNFL